MVVSAGNRGGSAGPSPYSRFTWWSYLLTQPGVVVHYLRLVVLALGIVPRLRLAAAADPALTLLVPAVPLWACSG